MHTVIVNHRVADFDTWLGYFLAHAEARQAAGFTGIKVHQAAGDPGNVFIIGQGDIGALQAFFSDPQLREVMQQAGVQGAPTVHILDAGQAYD